MIKQISKNVYQDTAGDTVSFKDGNLTFTALERDLDVAVKMLDDHYRKGDGSYLKEIGNIIAYLAPAIYNDIVISCPDLNVPALIAPVTSSDGFSLIVKWIRTRKDILDTEYISVDTDGISRVLTLLQYPRIDYAVSRILPDAYYKGAYTPESITEVLKDTYTTLCGWQISGNYRYMLTGDINTVLDCFARDGARSINPDHEVGTANSVLRIEKDNSLYESIIADTEGDVLIDGEIELYIKGRVRITDNSVVGDHASTIVNLWVMANSQPHQYSHHQDTISDIFTSVWGVVKYDKFMAMLKELDIQ